MREVLPENRSKPDNRGMMSECRFDGVIETMEFEEPDRSGCTGCAGLAQLKAGHESPEAHEVTMSVMRSRRRRGVCLDVAEYGVRSAVETTSAVVKLAFESSLVCETREVEVLESYEQGCVKGMCQRSISEKGEVTSVEEGRDVERATDGACVDLSCDEARERLTSRSLMSSTLWGVPQIQYIDRAVDILVMRGRWCFLLSREACACS